MKLSLIGFFLCVFFSISFSQELDTVKHSVKKAVIFSSIIPGSGQIYNHLAMPKGKKNAFWKVPLIYGALGATGYMVLMNNQLQKELKNEYNQRTSGNAGLEKYQQYDDQGVLTLYNSHLNKRDLFILGFGLVYLVQVVDAAVEAHFVSFDISEDLSLNISPTYLNYQQVGIKLSLNFVK